MDLIETSISATRSADLLPKDDSTLDSESLMRDLPDKQIMPCAETDSSSQICSATTNETISNGNPDQIQPLVTTHIQPIAGEVLPREPGEYRSLHENPSEDSQENKAQVTLVSNLDTLHDDKNEINEPCTQKENKNLFQFIRDLNSKARTKNQPLAHIRVGLHAQETDEPLWKYALLDCGCTDNLIALKTVQALSNFEKIQINTNSASVIRTANNDQSQQVHGTVNLNISMISRKNERICYRSTFLVVSGLIYDIFLGQPTVRSPQLSHQDSNFLFFHDKDQLATEPENQSYYQREQILHAVPKIYDIKRKLSTKKTVTIPPKTAQKIATNLVEKLPFNSDIFYSAEPTPKFRKKYPELHLMHQTVTPGSNSSVQVMLINTSDAAVTVKANRSLATLETHFKSNTFIEKLGHFLPTQGNDEPPPEIKPLAHTVQLNNLIVQETRKRLPPDRGFQDCQCNAAYTPTTFHEHELTPEEKEERNKQFRMEGYFQKSVSEVIENSSNFPSMDFEGDKHFVAKSPEQLLKECQLDHLSEKNRRQTLEMLKRNIDAFQRHSLDIGECKGITAYAPLTVKDPPVLYAKYRPIPLAYKEAAQKLIDLYVAAGVLAPTSEACKFTSNIFLIKKSDGTFRLIFDGRILSRFCKQLPLSLGSFDEIFSNLQGKTLVTKLDVSKAFDQIKVDGPTSRLLSFFGPNNRRYKYLRAGQGLKFSSFFLTQAMEMILDGLRDVTSYCDDIFIATSGTFKEHLDLLEEVIKRFKKYNVKLSIAKMEICPEKLDFLGLTWSRDKLSIPESKIMAYRKMKQPKSLKEARFIVNSTAFYRRFIPNFSKIIAPILELLKQKDAIKNFKQLWTTEHQTAIDELIDRLRDGCSLYLPRRDQPFILASDASEISASCTVSQYDETGALRLVAAVSRTFVKSERKLAPIHKEILSLLYALTSMNYILRGAELKVFCDARSIALLKTCSASSPYLARLALELSQYDFEIYHLPGQLNIVADALSRMAEGHDEILDQDKHSNDSMTKQESLEFLEFLQIPTNTRYTVSEVKHMLNSEPLRTEIKKRVRTRLSSSKKSVAENTPTTVRPKKTHQPQYTRSHPLERFDRKCDSSSMKPRSRSASFRHRNLKAGTNQKKENRKISPRSRSGSANRQSRAHSPVEHKDGDNGNQKKVVACLDNCTNRIRAIENNLIYTTCLNCQTERVIHPLTMDNLLDDQPPLSDSDSESSSEYSDFSSISNDFSESEDFDPILDFSISESEQFIATELNDENDPTGLPIPACDSLTCAIHSGDIGSQSPSNQGMDDTLLQCVLTDGDRHCQDAKQECNVTNDTSYPFEIPSPLLEDSDFLPPLIMSVQSHAL